MTIQSTTDGGATTKLSTVDGELLVSREGDQIVLRKYSRGWLFVRVASPAETETFDRIHAQMWTGRSWPLPRNQKFAEVIHG